MLVWICAGLSVVCGAAAALCQNPGRWLEKFICKTTASVLFCMTATLALARSGNWETACPLECWCAISWRKICLLCPF